MTRRRRSGLVLLLAGVVAPGGIGVAFLAADAQAAGVPRIIGTSHAPLVIAAGDRIAVTATVVGTGKRAVVGLVFGVGSGSAVGGFQVGTGTVVAHRGTRRVVVSGRMPANARPGVLGTVLVCINPAQAVKGKGSCHLAGRIATSGSSSEERIAGARRAGRLSRADAVLDGLLALNGDKRAPVELRGTATGPGGEQAALMSAANSFGTLPLAVRRQAFPFFVPPPVRGSAWQVAGRNFVVSHGTRASVAASPAPDCSGYDVLTGNAANNGGANAFPWTGVPTADGNAIVWYGTTTVAAFKGVEAKDRASAYLYARELPKIWASLTKEFGQPKSDANERCFHGPDGRLDVYVDRGVVQSLDFHGLAVTVPYPAVGNYPTAGKWCTDRPSWIGMQNGLSPWVLAHEFMHVLQFAHRYVSCDEPLAWWDEGEATWAGDFVYPHDNTERTFPRLVADPVNTDLVQAGYGAWPFWMMLQRTLGTDVLRSIFVQLRTQRSVQAVDTALSGGYAKQIPRLYLSVWNRSPVGDASFAVPQSFEAWDTWSQTPAVPAVSMLSLGTLPADTLLLPIQRTDGFPALSVGAYHRVMIGDDKIKQLTFTNDLAGKSGAHVDAMLHLADGSWKLADWTQMKTVTLCRDKPAENVRDMVIVSTNTSTHPLGRFVHTLLAGNTCPLPLRYDGTWTRIIKHPGQGTWTETIHGTATYTRPSYDLFPQFLDSSTQIPYQVTSSSVSWAVSGASGQGGCETYTGQGTESAITSSSSNSSAGSSELGIEDVSGRTPSPEPEPFYYSIDAYGPGDQNPDPNRGYTIANNCDPKNPHTSTDYLPSDYLTIGYATTYPHAPPDQILKSSDAAVLAGHHFDPGANPGDATTDDTWSFTGSG